VGGAAAGAALAPRRGRSEAPVRPLRLRARRAALAAALVVLAAPVAPLRAQGACQGQIIRAILVDPRTIFSPDDALIPGFVRTLGNDLHWRTRERTVRLDLLFAVGDRCNPRRLAETERLLRARPYLRSAEVTAVAAADGGVIVVVRTRDELSLEVRARISGGAGFPLRHLRLGEQNVLGEGLGASAEYTNLGRRPSSDFRLFDQHLFGRRYQAQFEGGKSEVGPVAEETVRRAFETDFDRVAWRESVRYRKEPFTLYSTTLGTVLQPLVNVGADVGMAARFGVPGALQVVGLALSAERLHVESAPLAQTPALDSAAAEALAGRFEERRVVRAQLLLGTRSITFHAHQGLDAVHALEDAPEGAEAGLVLGKSLFGGGKLQNDWFAAMELIAGAELTRRDLVFTRAKVEGRFVTPVGQWDGVLADAQVVLYHLAPRATTVVAVEGAGGWDVRTPFQLLLAGADGLRGYGGGGLPVGRRIVFHLERRYFLGSVFDFADVGAAVFADAGRGWAGDAAFGENTGLLGSVGAGLRLAVPRGSRRTYRLEVAVPLSRGLGPELRLAVNQQFGVFHGEPQDVVRSRERVSSVTVFDFPSF
jgi:hypothetical protein